MERKIYSLCLNKDEFEKIQELAASEDISASQYVRRLISAALRENHGNQ